MEGDGGVAAEKRASAALLAVPSRAEDGSGLAAHVLPDHSHDWAPVEVDDLEGDLSMAVNMLKAIAERGPKMADNVRCLIAPDTYSQPDRGIGEASHHLTAFLGALGVHHLMFLRAKDQVPRLPRPEGAAHAPLSGGNASEVVQSARTEQEVAAGAAAAGAAAVAVPAAGAAAARDEPVGGNSLGVGPGLQVRELSCSFSSVGRATRLTPLLHAVPSAPAADLVLRGCCGHGTVHIGAGRRVRIVDVSPGSSLKGWVCHGVDDGDGPNPPHRGGGRGARVGVW